MTKTICPFCGEVKYGDGNVICPCEIKHTNKQS